MTSPHQRDILIGYLTQGAEDAEARYRALLQSNERAAQALIAEFNSSRLAAILFRGIDEQKDVWVQVVTSAVNEEELLRAQAALRAIEMIPEILIKALEAGVTAHATLSKEDEQPHNDD